MDRRWSARLGLLGLVLMVVGVLDPMEGSPVIAAGTVLSAVAASLVHAPFRRWAYLAGLLTVLGVAALFGMTALGGVGGTTGRSVWWLLLALPYPLGWILGLVAAVRLRRWLQPA